MKIDILRGNKEGKKIFIEYTYEQNEAAIEWFKRINNNLPFGDVFNLNLSRNFYKNISFFLEATNFNMTENIDEIDIQTLSLIVTYSMQSDIPQVAYVLEKIYENSKNSINWTIMDLAVGFELNTSISSIIHSFVTGIENNLNYMLISIMNTLNEDVKIVDKFESLEKYFDFKENSRDQRFKLNIISAIESYKKINYTDYISTKAFVDSLTLHQKITLFKISKIDNQHKLWSITLGHPNPNYDEIYNKLIVIFEKVRKIRNSISHVDFILDFRKIDYLKGLFKDVKNINSRLLSGTTTITYQKFKEECLKYIDKFKDEDKIKHMEKYFRYLTNFVI